jgi:hypothetical protein
VISASSVPADGKQIPSDVNNRKKSIPNAVPIYVPVIFLLCGGADEDCVEEVSCREVMVAGV